MSDIALSVLATVVSRPSADVAIIDAGSKTFCGDVFPPHAGLVGYGCTTDGQGGIIERMNEEHGIVRLSDGCAPAIGEKVAFYPNHVCTAVNLADELMIVRDGVVEACWEVIARGKRQ
jgi:D-serine deaminase-like pyridoxal phosphate-dependent protein